MSTPQNKPLTPPTSSGLSAVEELQLEALRKQIELQNLDLAVKQRVEDAFQADMASRRAMILSQQAELAAARENQTRKERYCSHLMENQRNATRGNFTGSKRLMVICQKCRKLWLENEQGRVLGYSSDPNVELPSHLFPKDIEIGGFKGFAQGN